MMYIDIVREEIKAKVDEINDLKFLGQIYILLVRHIGREKEKKH